MQVPAGLFLCLCGTSHLANHSRSTDTHEVAHEPVHSPGSAFVAHNCLLHCRLCCLAPTQGDPSHSVPLAAAAKGMATFVAVASDQATVSKPDSSSHPSFVALAHFLQGLKQVGW